MSEPTDGVVQVFGKDAEAVRAEARDKRAEIARAELELKTQIDNQRAELEAVRKRMELEFRERMAELEAKMKPLQKELAKLKEVMWTVDLYLGRDEEIELLLDGDPASDNEPIVVRQQVLAMDEESIIYLDQGGLDGQRGNVEAFFNWMTASMDHVTQIIPEPKCVVVLVPTRQKRNYDDPFTQMKMDELNKQSYWMIRNGNRLYRMSTDIVVGDRLVPTQKEFLEYFNRRSSFGNEPEPMEPGSEEWIKAEEAAGAQQRHYMRLMLVLQGLVDRSVVFHPLPAIPPNFMSAKSQADGKVRIINETDFVLESGRVPFRQWQRDLNSKLRVGMRIIADFGRGFNEVNDRESRYRGHSRLRPEGASYPESFQPYLIEEKKSGSFIIRYERTDTVYRESWDSGPAKRRASCVLFPGDGFVLPFDLVTVEEMENYLNARGERRAYLSMVPVLRAAIAAKKAEAEAEEPFKELLVGAILAEYDDDIHEIREALPELVTNWKIANRWARPLVSESPEQEAKAVGAIVTEYGLWRRAHQGDAERDRQAVQRAHQQVPDLLAVGRRRDGRYIAYAASEPLQDVWVDEYSWTKTGKFQGASRWQIPLGRTLASVVWLETTERWASWRLRESRSEHFSGPEAAEFAERHLFPYATGPAIAITYKRSDMTVGVGRFTLFAWHAPERDSKPNKGSSKSGYGAEEYIDEIHASWRRGPGGEMIALSILPGWGKDESDHWTDKGAHFGYSPGSGFDRLPSMPGMPKDELEAHQKQYGHPWTGQVLHWMDPAEWGEVLAAKGRISKRRKKAEKKDDTTKFKYLADRYVEQVSEKGQAIQLARLRQRFNEDFGTNDETLWQHHLSTLGRKFTPVRVMAGWALVAAMKAGVDPVGKTMAEATKGHQSYDAKVSIPKECADIIIEPLEDSKED